MRLVQETHHEKEKVLLLSRSGPQQQQASPEEQSKEGVVAVDPAGGLDEDMARRYFRQLVVGIDYLHRNEIIHYDIKPDNLLLSSDRKQLKVVDFGISAMFVKPGDDSSSSSSRTMGSPAFLSPELINSAQSASPVSGTAADIWAMGVTLYFMLTASLPFVSDQIMVMYSAIETQAPAIPDEWDAALVDLMSKIFDKHPASRIKMAELKRHPWVTNEGKLMPLSSSSNSHPGFPNSSPSARRGRWDSEIGTSSQRALVTEKELKESVRSGFTNRCPVFSELVENALKLSAWIPGASSTLSLPHHPPHSHLLRRRKELFFKEFHRQINERT